MAAPAFQRVQPLTMKQAAKPSGTRALFDGRAGAAVDVALYRREDIESGAVVAGPAIIAEDETSTFVSVNFDAHIDRAGCIVMNRKAA
jgi:N-methylhydantoinase A